MNTWGPVNPIESNQGDDNYPGISGDQTGVVCLSGGNSSGSRIR
jgi:hypothetical protein